MPSSRSILLAGSLFLALAAVPTAASADAPHADKALTGEHPASEVHRRAGVGCADCHGKGRAKKAVAAARCLGCHGPVAALVAKTAQVKPENPHDSPHWGPGMECYVCHRQHAKTVDWCAHCHDFRFQVP